MTRRRSVEIVHRNAPVVERIQALKAEHPFWGYRRIWAHLRFIDSLTINKKRVLRLMRAHDCLVKSSRVLKAKRTPPRQKPRPTVPNQWWGIDMTKVLIPQIGWLYLVIVLDWYTKKIVGQMASLRCTNAEWLTALDRAVNRQFPQGARDRGLSLMSDNGCQPTSLAFMKACHHLGITQAFTSYHNPKGNADTERVMRTLKEELLWLREWTSAPELTRALSAWIEWYNTRYLHSTLGYRTPCAVEQHYLFSHSTQSSVA
jgi:transposase InsO family protein